MVKSKALAFAPFGIPAKGSSSGPLAVGMIISAIGNAAGFFCSGIVIIGAGIVFALNGLGSRP